MSLKVNDVPVLDQRGQHGNGIGLLTEDGTILVSAYARKGQTNWNRTNTVGTQRRTIAFIDIQVNSFIPEKNDEGKIITNEDGTARGEIGSPILQKINGYVNQLKSNDEIGEPIINSIEQFVCKMSSASQNEFPITNLVNKTVIELVEEVINEACVQLNKMDAEGKITRHTNPQRAKAAAALAEMANRSDSKRKPHAQEEKQASDVSEGMSAAELMDQ